jgi:hypothetical protein
VRLGLIRKDWDMGCLSVVVSECYETGIDDSWKLEFATALLQGFGLHRAKLLPFLEGVFEGLVLTVRQCFVSFRCKSFEGRPQSVLLYKSSRKHLYMLGVEKSADCRLPWLERPIISGIGQLHMCVQPR